MQKYLILDSVWQNHQKFIVFLGYCGRFGKFYL